MIKLFYTNLIAIKLKLGFFFIVIVYSTFKHILETLFISIFIITFEEIKTIKQKQASII